MSGMAGTWYARLFKRDIFYCWIHEDEPAAAAGRTACQRSCVTSDRMNCDKYLLERTPTIWAHGSRQTWQPEAIFGGPLSLGCLSRKQLNVNDKWSEPRCMNRGCYRCSLEQYHLLK